MWPAFEGRGKTWRKKRDYFQGLGVDGRAILGRIRVTRLRIRKNSRLLQIRYWILVFRTLQRISLLLKELLASEELLSSHDRHCSVALSRLVLSFCSFPLQWDSVIHIGLLWHSIFHVRQHTTHTKYTTQNTTHHTTQNTTHHTTHAKQHTRNTTHTKHTTHAT